MSAKITSFLHSTFDKFIGSLSIRYVLPLIIVTPLISALTVMGWFSYQAGKQEIDDLILQVNEKSTKIIELDVKEFLQNPEILLQSELSTIQSGNLHLDNLPEIQRYLCQQLQKNQALHSLYIGTEQGNFIYVEKADTNFIARVRDKSTKGYQKSYELDSQGNRTKFLESSSYDHRTLTWYKLAKNTGKPVWSPVYHNIRNNTMEMSFSIPVYKQKSSSFQGIIATDFILSDLSSFLHQLEIGTNGKAVILERTGNIISESSLEQPFKIVNEKEKRLNITESQDPIIKATGEYLINRFNSWDRIKGEKQLSFPFKGDLQFVQITPLKDKLGIDRWLMVVVVPESDFLKHIYGYTRFILIIGISVAGVAVILSLLLVRWITQPIKQLQQAAKMLELEDFDEKILEEVASRQDEFGELGKVFLAMTNVIYSREQNWKQMVDSLQNDKIQKRKVKSLDPSKKQAENLEELLREAEHLRIKISGSTKNSP